MPGGGVPAGVVETFDVPPTPAAGRAMTRPGIQVLGSVAVPEGDIGVANFDVP